MKTKQRQLLNRLICHIILYTFLWVTFAPGLTFAAGTTPPSSSKGKKKAVTKNKVPRTPQEAEKMYAAREQARIKKAQAKHKAASDALDKKLSEKKSSDKKSSPAWESRTISDDGTVIEFSSKDKTVNISRVPVKNGKPIVNSKSPTEYDFYREVTWVNNEVYNIDVSPPNHQLTTYRSRSQFIGEDTGTCQ